MAPRREGRPTWASAGGAPPAHIISAAIHVAGIIDSYGSPVPAMRHGYRHYPSGGIFPPEDLRLGEQLLVDCGLVREREGVLFPTSELSSLVSAPQSEVVSLLLARAISIATPTWIDDGGSPPVDFLKIVEDLVPDPDRREAFLLAVGSRYDPSLDAALGARGEEEVAAAARRELSDLGRDDLALRVQWVSIVTDRLGYDVVAPRLDQGTRRLEVKTTGRFLNGTLAFYLTRNEVEAGRRDRSWSLVVCRVETDDRIAIVGWCRSAALEPYLPVDSPGGRWRVAELIIPSTLLVPGIPPAL